MAWPDPDRLHRTAKQLIDAGTAATYNEAVTIMEGFVLQIRVGARIDQDPAAQAALLTTINAGHRAFLGGVAVCVDDDPELTEGWAAGHTMAQAIRRFGGHLVDRLDNHRPTLVIGVPRTVPASDIVLYLTWAGWSGGLVEHEADRLSGDGMPLAGVIAGAFGVSECFQHYLGSTMAARRSAGISLWRPDLNWCEPDAVGPALRWLPSALWLLGLGHLGQAFAWSLGLLPYLTPSDTHIYLMDTDTLVDANRATGLLADAEDLNQRKTRVVARRLETLGLLTSIVERRFDDTTRPTSTEPSIALSGFDSPQPRRLLGDRFTRVIDAGLGAGHVDFLDMLLHTFPSALDPATAFPDGSRPAQQPTKPAYAHEIDRLVATGVDRGEASCGMTEVAGITVGAAFVGATAGAFAVGDVLRLLHGGPEFSVVTLDLRNPGYPLVAPNDQQRGAVNPGFVLARD